MVRIWRNPRNATKHMATWGKNECFPLEFSIAEQCGETPVIVKYPGQLASLRFIDILPNGPRLPIISERLREKIAPFIANTVQIIECNVECLSDGESARYCLLNVLSTIDAIDESGSDLMFMAGTKGSVIQGFHALKLKDIAEDVVLAREKRFLPMLYVGEDLSRMLNSRYSKFVWLPEVHELGKK